MNTENTWSGWQEVILPMLIMVVAFALLVIGLQGLTPSPTGDRPVVPVQTECVEWDAALPGIATLYLCEMNGEPYLIGSNGRYGRVMAPWTGGD